MRMNQDERRFDFHGLGAALKRARVEKGWTQAYVAELVDRDSRTIMNIENKGQYPSFDLFVVITMFEVEIIIHQIAVYLHHPCKEQQSALAQEGIRWLVCVIPPIFRAFFRTPAKCRR